MIVKINNIPSIVLRKWKHKKIKRYFVYEFLYLNEIFYCFFQYGEFCHKGFSRFWDSKEFKLIELKEKLDKRIFKKLDYLEF